MLPQAVVRELRAMQRLGLRPWLLEWGKENLVRPARDMTRRQLVVSASVGIWGGIFPIPPCTMPATLFCIMFYSAGVPRLQRFNVPMASVAVVINELMLPLDLLMMPGFMLLGQTAYNKLTDSELDCHVSSQLLEDLQEQPVETFKRFSTGFGLGILVWAAAAPLVLGQIRVLGALSKFAPGGR
ncbi:unnamed protein product [Polarella glacialis]|uniref:DUF2062 domain-containing protein n=1 Tax=Polarella glacialis TaxID=89957 RepID=A0A813FI37_POLGL|nr:unnamed protein product [Polarella glacialis]CAE8704803.1 unnamed protein product [Polarella glacialis]